MTETDLFCKYINTECSPNEELDFNGYAKWLEEKLLNIINTLESGIQTNRKIQDILTEIKGDLT